MCNCPAHKSPKADCRCYCIHSSDSWEMRLYKKLMLRYGFDLVYRFMKRRENLAIWFVSKLPRWVIYRALIRGGVHASMDKWSDQTVPELLFFEVLERWNDTDKARK